MTQNNGENKALARIDTTTGEILNVQNDEDISLDSIVPYSALNGLVEEYRVSMWPDKRMPVHLAALEAMPISDDERLAIHDAYFSQESITMKSFVAKYANMDVRVWGMMIFEHPPYTSKPPNSQPMPGYYSPRLLVEVPKQEDFIVVRVASSYIGERVFYAMRKYGWWLFQEPITYRFNAGESGALFMQHVYEGKDSLKSRLSRKVTAK